MPDRISRDEVVQVARLARLGLTDDEIDRLTAELGTILDHEATIAALDLHDVAPTAHPLELVNVLRDDEPRDAAACDDVLAAAPATEEGRFRVPRILDDA